MLIGDFPPVPDSSEQERLRGCYRRLVGKTMHVLAVPLELPEPPAPRVPFCRKSEHAKSWQ